MSLLKKILLVEDDEFDADLTKGALTSMPLANEVIWLETGQEFLDYLQEHGPDRIAVVILDLNMPMMTGIEALEEIQEKGYAHPPIVILSSSRVHPDVKRCYELGVNSFVTKPVKTEDFREAIRTLGLYWGILNQLP